MWCQRYNTRYSFVQPWNRFTGQLVNVKILRQHCANQENNISRKCFARTQTFARTERHRYILGQAQLAAALVQESFRPKLKGIIELCRVQMGRLQSGHNESSLVKN